MGKVSIYTDLLTTENFGMCSKFIISVIRSGCEHFGSYTFTCRQALKYSEYAFKEENLNNCYNNLVEMGIVIREPSSFENEEGETFASHIDRINEEKLKKMLSV